MTVITPELLGLLAMLPLAILLLLISRHDVRSHRIPNRLIFIGIVIGFALNILIPEGWGFNSTLPGGLGWLGSLKGMGVGFALFLPIYLLRAMGAGDVKLMAMVGAFLGPNDVLGAALATFIAGGVMAMVVVLKSNQLVKLLQNIKLMLFGGLVKASVGKLPLMDDLPVSVGKLPYAVSIMVGTVGYLVWQRFYV